MKCIQLQAAYKDYLWGGTKLKEEYGKISDLERIAESWELSDHEAGQSIVLNGSHRGKTFGEYLKHNGREILGKNCEAFEDFPILIKFIDAAAPLSVQVHPDDTYALEKEHAYGKTEMWYVLSCEENAFLYYGVNQKLTKEAFYKHIEEHTVTQVLNKVLVKPGDVFFIEAGTIHAIGAGIVLCEIQQNSNITYRVYDYDRKDAQGRTRPLHIQQALQVCHLEPPPPRLMKQGMHVNGSKLASCKYFKAALYTISDRYEIEMTPYSFESLIILEGTGHLKEGSESLPFKKGDSFFVPANTQNVSIEGKCKMIVSEV